MRRVIALVIGILLAAAPALAQNEPEYTAFYVARLLSEDGTQIEAEFQVYNLGADATQSADVALRELGDSTVLATSDVPPLASGETYDLLLSFPVSRFSDVTPEAETVVFELNITSPEFDPVRRLAEFTIPAAPAQPAAPSGGTPQQPATTPGTGTLTTVQQFIEDTVPFEIDLSSRVQLAGLVAIVAALVVMLWLLWVIVRLLFVPKPTYPLNPPPYAGMPQMNPDSIHGRRQMWQQVAQHGSMLAEETEGNLHARKLLTDMSGERFSGWKIVGVRASQYDTYGRVTRTQVIAPNRILRRLNRTIDRAEVIEPDTARQRVRPVAKWLTGQLRGSINKRNAALPIALDVKFKGAHGEVNIFFELYQFQVGAWRKLDRWQPEMTVTGKSIYEAYTYTIHGWQHGETMRQFRRRLRDDMTYLLTEMVLCTPPPLEPTTRQTKEVEATDAQRTTQQSQPPVRSGAASTENNMRPVSPDVDESLMDTMTNSPQESS